MKTSRQSSSTRASSSPSSQESSTPSDDSSTASEALEIVDSIMLAEREPPRVRRRHIMQLVASPTWVVTHIDLSRPCQTCSGNERLVTRSIVSATYLTDGEIAICYRCLARIDLKRQHEQYEAERAFIWHSTTSSTD